MRDGAIFKNNSRSGTYSTGGNDRGVPLVRVIIVFSIVIMLMNAGIIVKRSISGYDEALNAGKEDSQTITRTIVDHIELAFNAVDVTLKRAVDRQHFNSLFGNKLYADLQHHISVWTDESPQIAAMLVADDIGRIQAFHGKNKFKNWLDDTDNITAEEFFQSHRQSYDSAFLNVSWSDSGIEGHEGLVVVSRRLNKLDGSFGGVVLAAVDSEYVLQFFRSLEYEKSTRMAIFHTDDKLLVNQLQTEEELSLLGGVMREQKILSNPRLANIIIEDNYDDRLRIVSFAHIPNIHMMLAVISYDEDIFAKWREVRINDVLFLVIFLLFVLVISLFAIAVVQQMQRVQRSESAAIMASQAKSEFLANMSHELRTPLNAIIGFSEMLESGFFGRVNVKQKDRLQDIHSCGNHLLSLINDILEFSKGEAGKVELRPAKMSINHMIRDVERILSEKATRDGVKLLTKLADNMPALYADERKLKQILINLISNSLKFTDSGGTVEIANGITPSGKPYFAVTDTGTGMAEEDIPRALSAFGQVHDDPAIGGTGLGLPLCKMFAELHGGEMMIQSILDVGTKITITLPESRIAREDVHTMHPNDPILSNSNSS